MGEHEWELKMAVYLAVLHACMSLYKQTTTLRFHPDSLPIVFFFFFSLASTCHYTAMPLSAVFAFLTRLLFVSALLLVFFSYSLASVV